MDKKHTRTQIMNVEDVAKYLGIHTVTVYRLIHNSDIPVFKLQGQWRFKKDILDEWLTKRIKDRQARGKKK